MNDCDSTDQTCTFKNPVVEECMQQWLMNDVDDVLTSIVVDDWSQKLQNVPSVRPCTIHEHFQSDVGGERDNALKMAFDTKSKTLGPRNEQDMVDVMMTINTVDDLATSLLSYKIYI